MRKEYKIFLVSFILSLFFWWGISIFAKNLEDFFFWQEISKRPEIFTAQANQLILKDKIERLKFERLQTECLKNLKIDARAAISVLVNERSGEKEEKILFAKNTDQKLPIASLTKLMTALIVLENYDLSKEITISKEAVSQAEDFGKLEAGKQYHAEYLLYPLLMESSNDAAFSLANDYDEMTEEKFVEFMNLEARKMNLENTFFVNSTGLDPEEPGTRINPVRDSESEEEAISGSIANGVNYSTVADLVKLTEELLNLKKPRSQIEGRANGARRSLIWEILSTSEFNLYGPKLTNTNKFLEKSASWQDRIIGGKTGYTDRAGECFLLVLKPPTENKGYFINIILGSNDRFEEMLRLVSHIENAYKW